MNTLVYAPAFYHDDTATHYLDESCKLLGIPLQKYGMNEGFPGGVAAKINRNIEFLKQRVGEYTHALLCDAGDTFYLRPLADIEEAYLKFNTPLVISVEPECYPHSESHLHSYPPSPTRWRFINSGHYMGEYGYLLECLKCLQEVSKSGGLQDGDQSYWHMMLGKGMVYPEMLDYHCQLFQPMANSKGAIGQFGQHGVIHNKATGSYPCAIHFNGRSGDVGEWFEGWRAGR